MWMTNTDVKNHTSVRQLVLKVKNGERAVNSTGMIDTRLFSGKNKLYAFRDPVTLLWKLRYEFGAIPSALQMSWTKFGYLLDHTRIYFAKRNVEITEVIDVEEDQLPNATGS